MMIETKFNEQCGDCTRTWNVYTFPSFGDFVEYGINRKDWSEWQSSRRIGREDWAGTYSWEQAIELAQRGWPEGSAKAANLSNTFVNRIGSLIPREVMYYDVTGRDFDIGMVLEGRPESWYDFHTVVDEGAGKFLKITFNTCTSAGIEASVMETKGATIGALVSLLETVGHHVELWIIDANTSRNKSADMLHEVLIKSADQPLDIDRIMFALAHPSMFRRLMFAAYEGHKDCWPRTAYGCPTQVPVTKRGDLYIDSAHLYDPQWTSVARAQEWLIGQLNAQGIEISR